MMYLIMGDLLVDYALWIGFWCCFGSIVCLVTMARHVERTGAQSFLVAILTLLLLASAVLIPAFSVPQLRKLH